MAVRFAEENRGKINDQYVEYLTRTASDTLALGSHLYQCRLQVATNSVVQSKETSRTLCEQNWSFQIQPLTSVSGRDSSTHTGTTTVGLVFQAVYYGLSIVYLTPASFPPTARCFRTKRKINGVFNNIRVTVSPFSDSIYYH